MVVSNWKDKFYKAYTKQQSSVIASLLYEKAPSSLLKFSKIDFKNGDSVYLDTVLNNEIWLSNPKEFNDPFDCAMLIEDEAMDHNEIEISKAKVFDSIKQNIFISCFSEKGLLDKPLMWAHYAESHKGICLEYDFAEIVLCELSILPVLYKNDFKGLNKLYEKNKDEFTLNAIYTKATDWKYEHEWRLLKFRKISEKGFKMDFIKPKNIYIGCKNNSEELTKILIDYCKQQAIGLYEMKMKPNSFKLYHEKISTQ